MKENEIKTFLERMEDRIMDYTLQIPLYENYCDVLLDLYQLNTPIDYLKYAYLLKDAKVAEPQNRMETLKLYDYKFKIHDLIKELEPKKTK